MKINTLMFIAQSYTTSVSLIEVDEFSPHEGRSQQSVQVSLNDYYLGKKQRILRMSTVPVHRLSSTLI
jgi:hypothetical protein